MDRDGQKAHINREDSKTMRGHPVCLSPTNMRHINRITEPIYFSETAFHVAQVSLKFKNDFELLILPAPLSEY